MNYPIDEATLYYSFRTIAQALAGALAVLVAVVVFRLAALDKGLAELDGALQSGRWGARIHLAADAMRRDCEGAHAAYQVRSEITRT